MKKLIEIIISLIAGIGIVYAVFNAEYFLAILFLVVLILPWVKREKKEKNRYS